MNFIVTGGCGYIGSHLTKRLYEEGHNVFIFDNFVNPSSLNRRDFIIQNNWALVYDVDISNVSQVNAWINQNANIAISCVFHLAALKDISESIRNAGWYQFNNFLGTTMICDHFDCPVLFSSSCSIYGEPKNCTGQVAENDDLSPQNPYSTSKKDCEKHILKHTQNSIILRYFNPIGCHISELKDVSTNCISSALRSGSINIYGDNPIRDYIHISDLIDFHIIALGKLLSESEIKKTYNLGRGIAVTVNDICNEYKKYVNTNLHIQFAEKRSGDISRIYANMDLVKKEYDWTPSKTLRDMVEDIQ